MPKRVMSDRAHLHVVVKDIAMGAQDLGFDSRAGQIGHRRQRLATAATRDGHFSR